MAEDGAYNDVALPESSPAEDARELLPTVSVLARAGPAGYGNHDDRAGVGAVRGLIAAGDVAVGWAVGAGRSTASLDEHVADAAIPMAVSTQPRLAEQVRDEGVPSAPALMPSPAATARNTRESIDAAPGVRRSRSYHSQDQSERVLQTAGPVVSRPYLDRRRHTFACQRQSCVLSSCAHRLC